MNTDNNITDKPTILAVDDNPSSFDQISNTFGTQHQFYLMLIIKTGWK